MIKKLISKNKVFQEKSKLRRQKSLLILLIGILTIISLSLITTTLSNKDFTNGAVNTLKADIDALKLDEHDRLISEYSEALEMAKSSLSSHQEQLNQLNDVAINNPLDGLKENLITLKNSHISPEFFNLSSFLEENSVENRGLWANGLSVGDHNRTLNVYELMNLYDVKSFSNRMDDAVTKAAADFIFPYSSNLVVTLTESSAEQIQQEIPEHIINLATVLGSDHYYSNTRHNIAYHTFYVAYYKFIEQLLTSDLNNTEHLLELSKAYDQLVFLDDHFDYSAIDQLFNKHESMAYDMIWDTYAVRFNKKLVTRKSDNPQNWSLFRKTAYKGQYAVDFLSQNQTLSMNHLNNLLHENISKLENLLDK